MNAIWAFPKTVTPHLPPVQVLSIDYLKNVTPPEGEPSLSAWNQFVIGWVVVEMSFYINLAHR